ncbi:MAG: aldo/keto reductase [Armatimonadota bacterium]
MEYRRFGKTGLDVSIIGFGGIVVMSATQEDANRAVAMAIDRGVNYFDVAPGYGDAEERLGPALDGLRDGVVLACKTAERTSEAAEESLHRSLKRLRTDHFDIFQFHGVPDCATLDVIFGADGAMKTFIKAREEGLIRNIGITTHTPEVALDAMSRFDFDSILFPINFSYWYNKGVGLQVLEEAARKGMGRAAMKSMALQPWPEHEEHKWNKCWYMPNDDPELAALALRFTLSQDINVAMPPGHVELFEMALDVAEKFKPIEQDEIERLKQAAVGLEPIF